MGQQDYFNIGDPLGPGVDFFGTDIPSASSGIVCSADLTVSAIKITSTSNASDILSDSTTSAIKIVYATANLACDGGTVFFSIGISIAQTIMSSDVDLTVSASKIAKTSPQLTDINCDVTTNSQKIAYSLSQISSSTGVISTGIRIVFIQDEIIALAGASVLLNLLYRSADISLSINNTNVIARASRFSPNYIDDTFYKTLFLLDDKPLTNHGRTTSTDFNQVYVEVKNWNANKSRYYKRSGATSRKSFSISWSMVPNSRYHTVDQRYGRDYIRQIAQDPDVHTLKIYNNDSSGLTSYTETTYNVYVKDYSESLVRRDLNNNIYLWECSLTLEEA